MDLLLPAWCDVVWSATAVCTLVLLVIALLTLSRSANSLSSLHALVWTLVALFVSIAGPLAWLLIGRRSANTSRDDMATRVAR
ncbi:PLDc N-terminal domain-containing protein [Microbacterium gubbeenense]|uniref:PLDc N-terminal domain-containing protein n=1 Tax=Microbacterium gubbeenense TaxID=159896 RepID=UPI000A00AAE8